MHKLMFRSWDVFNNSSTAELSFEVADGVEPNVVAIEPSEYPVRGNTSINVYHDRAGSQVTVDLEIFDISGRKLAMRSVSESASSGMTVVPCVSYGSGSVQNTGI